MSGGAGAAARYPAVPPAFLGVWQRTLLEGPGIRTDTTASVFWLQTPHWHGDVRLPAERPDFSGCGSLADCNIAQRRWLAGQKGFAGLTEVTTVRAPAATSAPPETYCQWHRLVDFQPTARSRDYGRIVFRDAGAAMEEYGVDAPYHETWVRLPQSVGSAQAWRRDGPDGAGFGELLLMAGDCFFYLRDRLRALPPARDLLALVDAPEAAALLDMELSFGQWDAVAGSGVITHSTLPWREGKALARSAGWTAA